MSFTDRIKPSKEELLSNNKLRITSLTKNRVGSELASFAVAHASIELIHAFLPKQQKAITNKIAKKVIEPNIEWFDKLVKSAPAIFREEDNVGKTLEKMNKTERAKLYAEDILDLGMTIPLEMIAQGTAQGFLDKHSGLPNFNHPDSSKLENYFRGAWKQSEAVFADKAIQLGSVILMNGTGIGRKSSDNMEDGIRPMLKKVFSSIGITEQGAERMARQTVSMGIPNIMGMVGSIGILDNVYKKELAENISRNR